MLEMKKSKRRLANRDSHKSGPVHRGMSDRFTIFGQTVPRIAIINGMVLSFWGIASYVISDMSSITAMIPAFMGAPMLILGFLSERDENNSHHYMHASMVLALVMALGGLRVVTDFSDMSNLAIVSHLLLLQVGISFLIVGIRSFRHARLLREAGN